METMETWIPRLLQDNAMLPMCESPSYAKMLIQYVKLDDHEQAMAEKDHKYQQLMEKTVRFAEVYHNAHLSNWIDLVDEERAEEMAAKDPVYVEARDFLKETRSQFTDVQAWKEQQK